MSKNSKEEEALLTDCKKRQENCTSCPINRNRFERRKSSQRNVFTLIELLFVIAIIMILAAILLPALEQAKKMAQRTSCSSKERQMGGAFYCYSSDYNGYFPAIDDTVTYPSSYGRWYTFLAPYCGYQDWTPLNLLSKLSGLSGPSFFWCPSAYVGLPGLTTAWGKIAGYGMSRAIPPSSLSINYLIAYQTYPKPSLVTSPSTKILVGDSRDSKCLNGYWEFSQSDPGARYSFDYARHMTGANALMIDGHVEWMSARIILQKVATQTLY